MLMKSLILATTALALAATLNFGASAGVVTDGFHTLDQMADSTVEKRRKKRIPGGSGCDDPEDIIEHPECR
jgi:hypothetical protein